MTNWDTASPIAGREVDLDLTAHLCLVLCRFTRMPATPRKSANIVTTRSAAKAPTIFVIVAVLSGFEITVDVG